MLAFLGSFAGFDSAHFTSSHSFDWFAMSNIMSKVEFSKVGIEKSVTLLKHGSSTKKLYLWALTVLSDFPTKKALGEIADNFSLFVVKYNKSFMKSEKKFYFTLSCSQIISIIKFGRVRRQNVLVNGLVPLNKHDAYQLILSY